MLRVKNFGVKPSFVGGNEWYTESLLYLNNKPVFKFGPMSETSTFAFRKGSEIYDVEAWAEWQANNGMGYVRCYPEQGYGWVSTDARGRLYPFDQVEPLIFDLERFNKEYWDNFRQVGKLFLKKEILIHLQLVQVCYFKLWKSKDRRWQSNYWNPLNNVNGWTVNLKPEFPFSDQNPKVLGHWRKYVNAILDSIGDLGNVLLDLGNELDGQQEWVDWNLEIIKDWEDKNNIKLIKGLDYTHMPSPVAVLGDDRFDVIMTHGEFIDDAPLLRRLYGKPVVSIISRDSGYLGLGEGSQAGSRAEIDEYNEDRFRRFHYRCLMNKVQGVGDYGKIMGGQEPKLMGLEREVSVSVNDIQIKKFALEAKILTNIFHEIIDYSTLIPSSYIIAASPSPSTYCLMSKNEILIYLEAGISQHADGKIFSASKLIVDLNMVGPSRDKFKSVNEIIEIIHPSTGDKKILKILQYKNDPIEIELPEFENDLLIHIY